MNIRSITCFVNAGRGPRDADAIRSLGRLANEAREILGSAGYPVQTSRLATQPLSLLAGEPLRLSAELWGLCADAGFEYLSVGPVLADSPDADLARLELIPDLIRSTGSLFASVLVASRGRGVHLGAIRETARIVRTIAHTTDRGFGNLRLAMLANVGPHAPFFPAAYHDGGPPAVAIATESADLAVSVLSQAGTLAEARAHLVAAVEMHTRRINDLMQPLAERLGCRFVGIDFSLAPFPVQERSIGAAFERLGVDCFGAPGTLFVASLLTDSLRRAQGQPCGFNGLMLSVLEDAVLAARSQEKTFTVNDLLLFSAVCGTGLDTVPLPGDMSEEELAGILLDVAALALRLDKPLTARLMPVPGAKAGDRTAFDFLYFANACILEAKGAASHRLFEKGTWLAM